jgi:hypothetical protein
MREGAKLGAELGEMAAEVAGLLEGADDDVRERVELFRRELGALKVENAGDGDLDEGLDRIRALFADLTGRALPPKREDPVRDQSDEEGERGRGREKGGGVEDAF